MCFLFRGMGWVFIIIFRMHPVYDMGGPDITSDGRVDRSLTPPEIKMHIPCQQPSGFLIRWHTEIFLKMFFYSDNIGT